LVLVINVLKSLYSSSIPLVKNNLLKLEAIKPIIIIPRNPTITFDNNVEDFLRTLFLFNLLIIDSLM
tara:strand:+ start:2347 stop:2547 length:201 start_codon:yes stop_codon:yes gene_type:complete